jgi:ParB-like chromosome segregation protein Spo0J
MSERIELVEVETADFIPYALNPEKNDHVVDRMASSIKEFGFKIPVLITKVKRSSRALEAEGNAQTVYQNGPGDCLR